MKKLILITGIFLISAFAQEKKYKIELNENQVQMLWSSLEFAKVNLQTSQAPANDVKNVIKIIDSLQTIIRTEYINQVDTTKKK